VTLYIACALAVGLVLIALWFVAMLGRYAWTSLREGRDNDERNEHLRGVQEEPAVVRGVRTRR
jgi:hypothetical protein